MYSFRKSKKGFTLIELMVVVVIIGVLALLGLRLYLTQIAKSNDALIKANAGTVQTTIQAELADLDADSVYALWTGGTMVVDTGIHNPLTKAPQTNSPTVSANTDPGDVWVFYDNTSTDAAFHINGRNHDGDDDVYTTVDLTSRF